MVLLKEFSEKLIMKKKQTTKNLPSRQRVISRSLSAVNLHLTADPGVMSSIPAQSHTFMEIDYIIVSRVILLLPLIQEGLLSVTTYKQKYVHKVLFNCFV